MTTRDYPALFEVSNGGFHPLGGRPSVTFGGEGQADVAIQGLSGNQLLFRIESEDDTWFVVPSSQDTPLKVDKTVVEGRVALRHLTIVQSGRDIFVFFEREDPNVATTFTASQWLIGELLKAPAEPAPFDEATLGGATVSGVDMAQTALLPEGLTGAVEDLAPSLKVAGAIELSLEELLIGRDSGRVDICLPDVRVSRVHARIRRQGRTATIADARSANGTFVDGQRVTQPTQIGEGSRIQIGPYSLVFTGTALFTLTHDKNVELVGQNLTRRVPDRENRGRMKVILEDVSLVIRPREFVCMLGPSGSGKSTLLSALSGRQKANEGIVLLNGENLYAQFEALKQNLAVVPQKDVLHDVLPLNTALWYTAKMRLPADMSREDIHRRITEMLDSVNMTPHRQTQIRRLSGGQIKRASWINEAICNPSLIFLDEVTSGLDQQTDCEMMQLFRQMADDGKTIVCVTHSIAYVQQNCDLLVLLAPGGSLAYVGPPADAKAYFRIEDLGDAYQRLTERSPQEWKQRFRESSLYEEYVQRRLPDSAAPVPKKAGKTTSITRRTAGSAKTAWRQFFLLTRRYLAIQWSDKRSLAMMLGQSLFIAALLIWLFGDISNLDVETEAQRMAEDVTFDMEWEDLFEEDQEEFREEAEEIKRAAYSAKVLFMLCVSCIWFGCNNSAKEIVKERSIYNKERDVGLNSLSYYGSKLLLLGVLSVFQASLLYFCVLYCTRLGGNAPEQWLLLSLTAVAGTAMGLAISAVSNTSDLAATIVPISLIPQIIFSGLIAPLDGLNRLFSQVFVTAYWSYQGLLGRLGPPLTSRLRDSDLLDLGDEVSLTAICGFLVAHIAVFAAVAIVALYARDVKDNRLLRLLRRSSTAAAGKPRATSS